MDSYKLASEISTRLRNSDQATTKMIADAVEAFSPLGWAMSASWHQEGTKKVVQAAKHAESTEEIDEIISEMWNTDGANLLKRGAAPIRRWSNMHGPLKQILWDRTKLIEKAIEHHFNGHYEASIPIILAQIEGLSRDLTGQSFFSKSNGDPYLDEETIAGIDANLPIVRAVFSEDVKESGNFGKPSRHGVHHGRDLGYGTLINSTKAIVLITALSEYFPKIADTTGESQRRAHEIRVAGSTAVDGQGRRVDDRDVPELINFTWKVETEYLKSVQFGDKTYDIRKSIRRAAILNALDPTQFHIEDSLDGWRWHYRTRSGQVLGIAGRPTQKGDVKKTEIWRWDATTLPTGFPWENISQWVHYDFPPPPNWDPKIIIESIR